MDTNFLWHVGQEIREARIKKGMSQQDLSYEIGVLDNTTVSRYENGTVAMSILRFSKICQILEIDGGEIYNKCYARIENTARYY